VAGDALLKGEFGIAAAASSVAVDLPLFVLTLTLSGGVGAVEFFAPSCGGDASSAGCSALPSAGLKFDEPAVTGP